uniref:SEC23 interacting protein n=1 Tax=Aotus nancymaae TaxID=37293 RepID=A0A2K5EDN7_AOTNA
MAERKPNDGSSGASISSSGTNLLFSSSATEFNFNVPFIPVTQASASPASLLLPGEDSTDVGEEDSFLGQTSIHTSTPQTFSYFSQVSSSSDPFGNIGQSPLTTAATSVGQSAFPKPLTTLPFTTGSQDISNAFSPPISKAQPGAPPSSLMGTNTYLPSQPSSLPPSNFGSPPQGIPQPGYNPYRHTPGSSRANPYIAPPQLQQCQTPGPPAHPPPSGPPVQMYQMPPGSLPPVPPSVQSPVQQQILARPGAPSVQMPPPFLLQNPYEPIQPHWFYCKEVEYKQLWMPFSVFDSLNLEEIYNSGKHCFLSLIIVVCGLAFGNYKLYLKFFLKAKKRVIVQFQPSSVPDEWGTTQDGHTRPRVVKRGIDDNLDEIPDGEMPQIDHLVFVVHGIGPVCDLRFRSIIECGWFLSNCCRHISRNL